MRSKSEVIISNALREYNIPYLYEKPVTLGKEVTVYPDFTILKLKERREIMGINLITTFETKEVPLDVRVVRSKIEAYLV